MAAKIGPDLEEARELVRRERDSVLSQIDRVDKELIAARNRVQALQDELEGYIERKDALFVALKRLK